MELLDHQAEEPPASPSSTDSDSKQYNTRQQRYRGSSAIGTQARSPGGGGRTDPNDVSTKANKELKRSKIYTRVLWGAMMVAGFFSVIWLGHVYIVLLVLVRTSNVYCSESLCCDARQGDL